MAISFSNGIIQETQNESQDLYLTIVDYIYNK
jgi:hypothetical protein